MKKVSFEVAKALKEAGYPQGNTDKCYLTADHNQYYKKGQIVYNEDDYWTILTKNLADIPTYIEAWLWLWREKNIRFDVEDLWDANLSYPERGCASNTNQLGGICTPEVSDPEEAIIKAINYLVDNDLLQ